MNGAVRLYTKNGYDWAERYPLMVDALYRLKVSSIVLDGEAMTAGPDGRDSFDALWNRINDESVRLCAFDLLELDGEDLRPLPLQERKRRLQKLLRKDRAGLEFVEHVEGEGPIIFGHACKLGLEGIVSKRIDLPYRAGLSKGQDKEQGSPSHNASQGSL